MSISASELESILAERLQLVRNEKSAVRESIEELEAKIRLSKRALADTPRESEDEIVATMKKLEHTHATTSMSNAEEREFMREMDKLRQKRKAAAAGVKVKADLEEQRTKLTELRRSQAEKDDSITELHQGLRKVKLANRSGCTSADITERKFTVESGKVARIVGKGGSNLRFLESEHNVSIEIDNNGGLVRLMGLESSIASAFEAIMGIVETSIEEFPLSDEIIVCLMMDKAQRVNDIQAQYGVRLDISRAKNLCKVSGLTENVIAAKALIVSLQSIRTDMLLEPTAISAIIGKGGSSITALQEEFRVAINVNRDNNTVEVVGMRSDVTSALARIRDLVEVNREVEEVIQLEKHVLLGCLMGSNGQGLRGISKEYGVRIDCEVVKENALQVVKIKGNNGKVHQARAHIVQLVGEYISNTLVVPVPDDVIPVILGKGGSEIKAFREKFPSANIDIEGCNVHIQSDSAEMRATIKAEIDNILEANFSEVVNFSEEEKTQLKSAQGAEVRSRITKDLNVRLVIDFSPTAIKVKGPRPDVLRAVAALQTFRSSHTNEKVVLTEEDFLVLHNARTKGGDDSVVRGFEAQYNVEIRAQRKELTLFISGTPEGVAATKQAIQGVLEGDAQYGSQIISLHKLVTPTLIGKAGSNIIKMENELGVKFDVLKAREQLRIIGDSAEKVQEARQAVLRFVQVCRVTDTLTVVAAVSKKDADLMVRRATEIYQAEITSTSQKTASGSADNNAAGSRSMVIKGTFAMVQACKEFLVQQLTGASVVTIPVGENHYGALEKQTHGSLKRLQDKAGVSLKLSSDPCEVRIEGSTEAVATAKREVIKLLERYFPAEVVLFDIPASCLRECFGEDFAEELTKTVGVAVSVDRASSTLMLLGGEEKLAVARKSVEDRVSQWEDCHASLPIDSSLVPSLVGKSGASINALRKETNVSIDINTAGTSVEIKGSSKEQVAAARITVQERIRQLQAERWEHSTSTEFLPLLIGKQGATINKLRTDTGAGIDIDGNIVKVYGAEDKVAAAKEAILELLTAAEAKQAGSKVLILPPNSIAIIIGSKGSTVRELQEKTGVRFDFDRVHNKCSLKGSVEGVGEAVRLVHDILSEGGYGPAAIEGTARPASPPVEIANEPTEDTTGAEKIPIRAKTLPGAPPNMVQRIVDKNLSKSALKRLRRKLAQENGTKAEQGDEENEEDEEDDEDDENESGAAEEGKVEKEESVPTTAPVIQITTSTLQQPVPSVTSSVISSMPPVAATPAPASAPVAASAVPKLGVIGKSPKLVPLEVESFQSSQFGLAQSAAAPAQATATATATAPHMLQQQQLINLLLGDSSVAPQQNYKLTEPVHAQTHAHATAPTPQVHSYQPHVGAPQFQYQYQQPPVQNIYQPSSLYAPSAALPLHQSSSRASVGSAVPPPGILPPGRRTTAPVGLSVATSAGAYSPPPPGLTPPGGVSISRFTFADYPPAASAPASAHTAPAPLPASYVPTQAPVGSHFNGLYGQYEQQGQPVAPAVASKPTSNSGNNYYKSKSGFSVRL